MTKLEVRPLTSAERTLFTDLVVGITTCPHCGQDDIKVVNDSGKSGAEMFNYLENHSSKGKPTLCIGSEKMLTDF